MNRRHHCRRCGQVICGACSGHEWPLPRIMGHAAPVRICNVCYDTLASGGPEVVVRSIGVALTAVASTEEARPTRKKKKQRRAKEAEMVKKKGARAKDSTLLPDGSQAPRKRALDYSLGGSDEDSSNGTDDEISPDDVSPIANGAGVGGTDAGTNGDVLTAARRRSSGREFLPIAKRRDDSKSPSAEVEEKLG